MSEDVMGYTPEEVQQFFASEHSLDHLYSFLRALDSTHYSLETAIEIVTNVVNEHNVETLTGLQQIASLLDLSLLHPEKTYAYLRRDAKGPVIVDSTKTLYLAHKVEGSYLLHPVALSATPGRHGTIDAYRVGRGQKNAIEPQPGVSLQKIGQQKLGRRTIERNTSHIVQVASLSFDERGLPIRQPMPSAINMLPEYNELQRAIAFSHKTLRRGVLEH